MITKNDCLSLLVKLENKGLNVDSYMKQLIIAKDIPLEVLKFIAQNQGLELGNFYEMLRRNHNKKKSPLYTNILKDIEDSRKETANILTTMSCLLTQVILYHNKLTDSKSQDSFMKEARAEEITRVLNEYFKTGNIEPCLTLLRLVKTDILVLEYLNNRRTLK